MPECVRGRVDAAQRHDIPSVSELPRACHEGTDTPVLGFSALQLSPDRDPLAPHAEPVRPEDLDLRKLAALGLLRNLPPKLLTSAPRIAANDPVERAALGYLHGNCGHCHASATDAAVPVDIQLSQHAGQPQASRPKRDAVSRYQPAGMDAPLRYIEPGRPDRSVLVLRMRSRDARTQMPPLGTHLPDADALALIERWITDQSATTEGDMR